MKPMTCHPRKPYNIYS